MQRKLTGIFLSLALCFLVTQPSHLLSQDNGESSAADSSLGPVIDDETSELDTTVVTSSPAPARTPTTNQTVRSATATRPVEIEVYDTIDPEIISGGAAKTVDLTGSGFFVTTGDIRDQNYTNINRVLAKVPGVYTREEDGAGLFPNISIRGVDGTRSEKITVMEDGILQAPSPYSAPAAYYSPNVGRMAGVEILKGSSQIAYGPQTTGGVINFLSTPIPDQEQFYLRTTYGSNSTAQIHSHYGNTIVTENGGKLGYLAEIYYKRSDGFRTIDGAPAFGIQPSDETGYRVIEPMVKLSWEPNTAVKQRYEFKYGYTNVDSDETYLGLTDGDLAANPYRRYAGSFLDNIQTQHHRTYLKYDVSPNDTLDVQVAGYYNHFERDWFKIRQVNGTSLHTTLGPTGTAANLATLRGQAPGVLGYRSNAREYDSYGVQVKANQRFEIGSTKHEVELGVREHRDKVRRFQENSNINLLAGGGHVIVRGGPGSGGNRLQKTDATAIWLQDTIEIGSLTLTPGVRHETIDGRFVDYQANALNIPTNARNGDHDWTVAGIGFNLEVNDSQSIFGGFHQGIAVPSPRNLIRGTNPEESSAYEFGFRHGSDNFNAELVGFLTDFDEIISTSAGLALGNRGTRNAGTATVQGFEALVSFDPFQDQPVRMPTFISVTYTDTKLDQALTSGGGEDILADGTAGGQGIPGALPYIPEWKFTAGVGVETENWGVDLTATYLSDMFGTGLNSPFPVTSSRQGLIDGGTIVDLSCYYQINDQARFICGVHNLFEEVMVTSRIPEGPRANAPREFFVGFEILTEKP